MSKRGAESETGVGSAEKQRRGESVPGVESSEEQRRNDVVHEFSEATAYRTFRIVVEDRSFFVCPYTMRQLSSFFNTLCFGAFLEGREGKAELKDVKYSDFLELLLVLGVDFNMTRKEITASNCVRLMWLASRFAVDNLMKRCTEYIDTSFIKSPSTFLATLEVLLVCQETRVSERLIRLIASRLASFGLSTLFKYDVYSKLSTNDSLRSAIFVAASTYPKISTIPFPCIHMSIHDPYGSEERLSCKVLSCSSTKTGNCGYCEEHLYQCLISRDTNTFEEGVEYSSDYAPLDLRFFGEENTADRSTNCAVS